MFETGQKPVLEASGIIMLAVSAGAILLAHPTRFGANVYALGGSEASAALMGLPVARTRTTIHALSSALAGLAEVVFSMWTSAGYSLNALRVELDAIAAVVIGGTSLIAGTFIGFTQQGLVQTCIIHDGALSSWWTKTGVGLLLLIFLPQRLVFRADRDEAEAVDQVI